MASSPGSWARGSCLRVSGEGARWDGLSGTMSARRNVRESVLSLPALLTSFVPSIHQREMTTSDRGGS